MTYSDAQPRGNEIKDAVLARRMPPWGAVKGFGTLPERPEPDAGADRALHAMGRRRHPAGQQPAIAPKGPDVRDRGAAAGCTDGIAECQRSDRRCARTSCSTD